MSKPQLTLTVMFANRARRTFSSWIEMYRVFDKTPANIVHGSYIWERYDNEEKVQLFKVHNLDIPCSGYPLERIK